MLLLNDHWKSIYLFFFCNCQVEREMCSASAEFEDFVLQFMDRYGVFMQNSIVCNFHVMFLQRTSNVKTFLLKCALFCTDALP